MALISGMIKDHGRIIDRSKKDFFYETGWKVEPEHRILMDFSTCQTIWKIHLRNEGMRRAKKIEGEKEFFGEWYIYCKNMVSSGIHNESKEAVHFGIVCVMM